VYKIEKKPTDGKSYRRPGFAFNRARDGFSAFLKAARLKKDEKILLPGYIGWSSREGSGVFDPVSGLGVPYAFYGLTGRLEIDIEDLRRSFARNNVRAFVIIHYFGYVDRNYVQAVALARKYNALVLEDEAHAMFSDLIGGVAGRLGDAAIYSLHKLLPLSQGGMLVFNHPNHVLIPRIEGGRRVNDLLCMFDLKRIVDVRLRNTAALSRLIAPLRGSVEPLRRGLRPGEVPQTYPVLIRNGLRDRIYFMMNEAGYGVVSLYHTLIGQIEKDAFPAAHACSARILNLPVHQDIEEKTLVRMVDKLRDIILRLERE